MEWMLFAALAVLALFGFYEMAVCHGEEMVALKSRAESAENRVKLLTTSLRKKNEYIRILEKNAVKNADPATVARMLNDIFMREDEDSLPEPAVPSERGSGEARD